MRHIVLSTAIALFVSQAAIAAEAPLAKKDVEAIVKESIEQHPEWIMDSIQAFQNKKHLAELSETTVNTSTFQAELKNNKNAPVAGNAKGDVTVAEFFDYHCGYCKRSLSSVTKLLEEDKNIKFVFKEFPILSEDSTTAAKASIAVYHINPSKYFAFHTELMHSDGSFDEASLAGIAEKLGINADKLKKEMQSDEVKKELDSTREWANKLHVRGTPAFVIGGQLVPGAIEYDEIKAKIAEERKAKK